MKTIDGDRLLREIRKHNTRVVVDCKTKYFPLDLIRKIIREAPEVKSSKENNADLIRCMNNLQLARFLCSIDWRMGEEAECLEWLRQKAKEL